MNIKKLEWKNFSSGDGEEWCEGSIDQYKEICCILNDGKDIYIYFLEEMVESTTIIKSIDEAKEILQEKFEDLIRRSVDV